MPGSHGMRLQDTQNNLGYLAHLVLYRGAARVYDIDGGIVWAVSRTGYGI